MKLVDRYIFTKFLRVLIIFCISIMLFLIIVTIFEKFDDVTERNLSIFVLIEYIVYSLPSNLSRSLPSIVLLASIVAMVDLKRHGELLSLFSGGISIYRIFIPIVILGFMVCILSFTIDQTFGPKFNILAEERNKLIEGEKEKKVDEVWLRISKKMFLKIKKIDKTNNILENLSIFILDNDFSLREKIKAKLAKIKGNLWYLEDGVRTVYKAKVMTQPFKQKVYKINKKIEDLEFLTKSPEQLSFFQLKKYISELKEGGINVKKFLVDLYLKLSRPLSNLIMLILGISIALNMEKSRISYAIIVAIVLGFFYWVSLSIGVSLGYSEKLPPFLAAWIGNLIFGFINIYLFLKIRT